MQGEKIEKKKYKKKNDFKINVIFNVSMGTEIFDTNHNVSLGTAGKSWMCFFMSKKKKELCNNKSTRYKINNCKMQENVILLT